MHSHTRNKLAYLQKHINANASAWFQQYGSNLTSVQVQKKTTEKKIKRNYAIVFHVVKKKALEELSPSEVIPKSIQVKFPDNEILTLKTDVIETGKFQFHAQILDTVRDLQTGETGTLGLFVQDNHSNIYAITNYHVAADGLIKNHRLSFDVSLGDQSRDVGVAGFTGRLFKGKIDSEIDIAFIRLLSGAPVNNSFDLTRIVQDFVRGPFDGKLIHAPIKVFIRSKRSILPRIVINDEAPLNTGIMQFFELVSFPKAGIPGDSGGVVVNSKNQVLGIYVGSDPINSYCIPFYKVQDYFFTTIL